MSHRTHVKSVINHFCQWLIEEKEALERSPTRRVGVSISKPAFCTLNHLSQHTLLRMSLLRRVEPKNSVFSSLYRGKDESLPPKRVGESFLAILSVRNNCRFPAWEPLTYRIQDALC